MDTRKAIKYLRFVGIGFAEQAEAIGSNRETLRQIDWGNGKDLPKSQRDKLVLLVCKRQAEILNRFREVAGL